MGRYKNRERAAGHSGFTLMEVMITIVVLSLGLLAAGMMQVQSVRTNARSRDMTEAMYMAQGMVELIKAMPYDDENFLEDKTADGDPDAADVVREMNLNQIEGEADYSLTQGRYTLYWNVIEHYPVSQTKTVRVIAVCWDSPIRVRENYLDEDGNFVASGWSYPSIDYIAAP